MNNLAMACDQRNDAGSAALIDIAMHLGIEPGEALGREAFPLRRNGWNFSSARCLEADESKSRDKT